MFNRWKQYPKNKPLENGWYQCLMVYGNDPNQSYVMDLYYYKEANQWIDNRVQNIFDNYYVYNMKNNRLLTNIYSNRTSQVIAFKKIAKTSKYLIKKVLKKRERKCGLK